MNKSIKESGLSQAKKSIMLVIMIFAAFIISSSLVSANNSTNTTNSTIIPITYTADDFRLTLNQDKYYVNDTVFITAYAPDNTTLSVIINGTSEDGQTAYQEFETTVFTSTAMIFIPKFKGDFTVDAKMTLKNQTYDITDTIIARERLQCEINIAKNGVINTSISMNANVKGNEGDVFYFWDFDDGDTDGIPSPTHKFSNTGTHKVTLSIKDERNEGANCQDTITINEETYTLTIKTRAVKDDKILGDALVILEDQEKKTNVNGRVSFKELEEDEYELTVEKEGYTKYSADIDINSNKELVINLSEATPSEESLPKITIDGLENNLVVYNKDLGVRFKVSSDTEISECNLLLKEKSLLGYRISDQILNITDSNQKVLTGRLDNGEYTLKVSCKNNVGIGESEVYTIFGEGFPEKVTSPIQEGTSLKELAAKQDLANEESEEKIVEKKEVNNKITKEIDDLIKQVQEVQAQFKRLNKNQEFIKNALNLDVTLEKNLKELKKIRQERLDLEQLLISPKDKQIRVVEQQKNMIKIKSNTPSKITIAKKDSYIEQVTIEESYELQRSIFNAKELDISERKTRKLTESIRESQDMITTYVDLEHVNIEKLSGDIEKHSFVKKRFEVDGNISKGFLVEVIPPVIDKITDLKFSNRFEVVVENEVIKPNIAKIQDYHYRFEDHVDFDSLTKARSIMAIDPHDPQDMITGYSILGVGGDMGFSSIAMVILGVIATAGISTSFIMKRINKPKEENNNNNTPKTTANDTTNNTTPAQAIAETETTTEPETNPAKAQTLEVTQCVSLLNQALEHIGQKNNNGAIKLYPKILSNYSKLGSESQQQLAPIMNHISGLVDLQYIDSLFKQANTEFIENTHDTQGKLANEIEETYMELNDKLASKVKDKYEKYKYMKNLKMLRQDQKLKQFIERETKGSSSLDNIYNDLYHN